MATVILVISNNKDTGAQILLSHLLLVIKFNTVAIAEKVTTNQIAESANEFQSINTYLLYLTRLRQVTQG